MVNSSHVSFRVFPCRPYACALVRADASVAANREARSMIGNLSAVRREIDKAHGLPNAHYVDPEVFRAESEVLLADGWAAISVASEVPENGDA